MKRLFCWFLCACKPLLCPQITCVDVLSMPQTANLCPMFLSIAELPAIDGQSAKISRPIRSVTSLSITAIMWMRRCALRCASSTHNMN